MALTNPLKRLHTTREHSPNPVSSHLFTDFVVSRLSQLLELLLAPPASHCICPLCVCTQYSICMHNATEKKLLDLFI
jgi:hypothetical protein